MNTAVTYQSHGDGQSISDSARKLARIGLPESLDKKNVLDIGCNEGFFCAIAAERGASNIIGIDSNETAIDFARKKYSHKNIKFEVRQWSDLPSGSFDFVLWLSSMHYELDPLSIFKKIAARLTREGVFILECGIYLYDHQSMYQIPVGKPDGIPVYPTFQLLEAQLARAGFTFHLVADGEKTPGDNIPRFVYHCKKRIPTVLILRGKSQVGKSSFARLLRPVASKLIQLDGLLWVLAQSDFSKNVVCNYLNASFNRNDMEPVYDGIDSAGITREYVKFIKNSITDSDEFVVVEGYMTDRQVHELQSQLAEIAIVWDATTQVQQIRSKTSIHG